MKIHVKTARLVHDLLRGDLLESILSHFPNDEMQFVLDHPIILETGEKRDRVEFLTKNAAFIAPDDNSGYPVDNAYEDFHNIELIALLEVLEKDQGVWKIRLIEATI